jgi:hypothetical protein
MLYKQSGLKCNEKSVGDPEPVKRQLFAGAGANFLDRLLVCKFKKNTQKPRNFSYKKFQVKFLKNVVLYLKESFSDYLCLT